MPEDESITPEIRPWERIPGDVILGEGYGKKFIRRSFRRPRDSKVLDYTLFGQKDWSVVLPVTPDHKVVTVTQFKHGCEQVVMELPAGSVEPGEDPQEAARRELREETGHTSSKFVVLGLPQFMSTGSSWTRFHLFLAKECKKTGPQKLDENEEISIQLKPLNEWIELCKREIVEPSSIIATFRSLEFLGYRSCS